MTPLCASITVATCFWAVTGCTDSTQAPPLTLHIQGAIHTASGAAVPGAQFATAVFVKIPGSVPFPVDSFLLVADAAGKIDRTWYSWFGYGFGIPHSPSLDSVMVRATLLPSGSALPSIADSVMVSANYYDVSDVTLLFVIPASSSTLRPNSGLKLPGRLAALARDQLGLYASKPMASASKTPARSLNPSR